MIIFFIQRALPPIIGAVLANQINVVEFFTKQNDLDCSLEGVSVSHYPV